MSKVKLKKLSKFKMKSYKFDIARSIFNKWLSNNIHRFNIKPIYIGHDSYEFEGIVKNIFLKMSFDNYLDAFFVCIDDKDECYDLISVEYIGNLKYDSLKGYYDEDRVDGIFDYFETLDELYITNVFEHIIEYVNTNFIASNCLILSEYRWGTDAKIISKYDYRTRENRIDYIYNLYK